MCARIVFRSEPHEEFTRFYPSSADVKFLPCKLDGDIVHCVELGVKVKTLTDENGDSQDGDNQNSDSQNGDKR